MAAYKRFPAITGFGGAPGSMTRLHLDPDPEGQGGGTGEKGDPPPNPDEGKERKEGEKEAEKGSEEKETEEKPDPNAEELRATREALASMRKQFDELQGKLTERETAEQQRQREKAEAERQAEIEKHRKAGDFDKIEARYKNEVEEANKRAEAAERAIQDERLKLRSDVVEMRLTTELAKHRIADGWLPHLIKLYGSEFEAVDHGDRLEVQSKDHKSLESKVKEILSRPENKRIILASDGNPGAGSTRRAGSEGEQEKQTPIDDINKRLFESQVTGFGGNTLGGPRSFNVSKN